jgi:hypothetical protein
MSRGSMWQRMIADVTRGQRGVKSFQHELHTEA